MVRKDYRKELEFYNAGRNGSANYRAPFPPMFIDKLTFLIFPEEFCMKKISLFIMSAIIFCSITLAQDKPVPFRTQVRGWNSQSFLELSLIPNAQLTNVVQISAGLQGAAALLWNGKVRAWGGWDYYSDVLTNINKIACAEFVNLAIDRDGFLKPWGLYDECLNAPAGLSNLVDVSADNSTSFNNGPGHIIVLRADGTVAAWGVDWGNTNMYDIPLDLTNAVAVEAGFYENVVLRSDGSVTIIGGIPDYYNYKYVPPPKEISKAIAISINSGHSLVLLDDGKVIAWGGNNFGQCDIPADLGKVAAISAGVYHTVALLEDGTVVTWGEGGQVVMKDLRDVIAVSAGNGYFLVLISHELATSPPVIYAEPKSKKADLHQSAYLDAYAVGFPPIKYQWLKDNQPIAGATQKFLYFGNVVPSDYASYTVRVYNKFGSTLSETVTLKPASNALDFALVPSVRLFGDIGANYLIQYAESIEPASEWRPLSAITLTNSPQWYFDLSGLGQSRRFYRSQKMP